MGAGPLAQVLRPLRSQPTPPELIVGLATSDDAAVYLMAPGVAVVGTLDFFPPIVDDAYASGAIGAANALSDIYAMGGDVLFALNIAAWPDDLPLEQLEELFRGGVDKVNEAGGVIAGGHTISDREPKYGLSVTGRIDPDRIFTKAGLRPGDALYLTKPIGTGVLTTALKQELLAPEDLASVVASMAMLNRAASLAARDAGLHAATDVTGFSLAGHAQEMAERSGVQIRIDADAVPLLPSARGHAENTTVPGGMWRNREHYVDGGLVRLEGLDDATEYLMLDPQTSGGLLVGVPDAHREEWLEACVRHGVTAASIGSVSDGSGVVITRGA